MVEGEGKSRPSASGHRFGPDLACTECGVSWDQHQGDPQPCEKPADEGAFDRRPEPPKGDEAPGVGTLTTKGTVDTKEAVGVESRKEGS